MANGTGEDTRFPEWDASNTDQSLARAYQWAVQNAQEKIDWYAKRRRPKKQGSQWLRTFAIILAAIGALCPLVDAATPDNQTLSLGVMQITLSQLGQWGYVSIALAAALVGYDKFFGLSSGWMRYMVTELSLQRTLREFQYDWNILRAQQDQQQPPQNNTPTLLQRLKDFTLQVETLVRQETDAWVTEFQTNISELDKMLQAEAEARTPGSIKVTVTNARDFDKVTISLNGTQLKELTGVTESVLDSVPPGPQEVVVVGKKQNTPDRKDSKVVEVQPNALASAELTLPGPNSPSKLRPW
jgi:conflict system pore-forming effector with SLATT domain